MKKLVASFLIIVAVVTISVFPSKSGGSSIKVFVDNKQLNSEGLMIDGKVYLQIRPAVEALGAQVAWDANSKTVKISSTEDESIPEIIQQVSPCVVGIVGNYKDDIYYSSQRYTETIMHGTGVITKSTGEILTNAHVVKDMDKIVVILYDGSGYEAVLKYMDEATDLAVIKIAKSGLQAAIFGSQDDIVIGKKVIAIGTPVSLSLRNSATIGYISGVNRSLGSDYSLIQTDAAINPGNSGGPLINLHGEVIGINSSKYSGVGLEGLGFSIPVDTVNYALNHFNKYGKINRPTMGVTFEEDWAAKVGLPSKNGLRITAVSPNLPAEKYGVKAEDTLLRINDIPVNNIVDYNESMKKFLPGAKVVLKILRNNIYQNITVSLV